MDPVLSDLVEERIHARVKDIVAKNPPVYVLIIDCRPSGCVF